MVSQNGDRISSLGESNVNARTSATGRGSGKGSPGAARVLMPVMPIMRVAAVARIMPLYMALHPRARRPPQVFVRMRVGSAVLPRAPPRTVVDEDGVRAPCHIRVPPSERSESRAEEDSGAETNRGAYPKPGIGRANTIPGL